MLYWSFALFLNEIEYKHDQLEIYGYFITACNKYSPPKLYLSLEHQESITPVYDK